MKKKHMQQQLKQEDQMLQLSKRWANDILPNWELTWVSKCFSVQPPQEIFAESFLKGVSLAQSDMAFKNDQEDVKIEMA